MQDRTAQYDREYDGKPRPWVPDASDCETDPLYGEQCDVCGDLVTDLYPGTTVVNFNQHNSEAYIRHLEITGELHVLDCVACGKRTNPETDEFVPGIGSLHPTCEQPTTTR